MKLFIFRCYNKNDTLKKLKKNQSSSSSLSLSVYVPNLFPVDGYLI